MKGCRRSYPHCKSNNPVIPVAFEGVRSLAALAHPNHLLFVGSWGFTRLPPTHTSKSFGYRNRGVGLIEVLIALLVISIGILGMAGLQSRSLQHNQIAYVRSQAVILANDMMDRIRANRSLAESTSNYVVSKSQHLADDCTEDYYPDTCEAASCNAEALAEYDLRQWKFQLACQLPEAEGSIAIENTSSGPLYRITLEFDESRGEQAPTAVILRSAL